MGAMHLYELSVYLCHICTAQHDVVIELREKKSTGISKAF
jgi:hypothetical protein